MSGTSVRLSGNGRFQIDLKYNYLYYAGNLIDLDLQDFKVFRALYESSPAFLRVPEIIDTAWIGTSVGDNSVHQSIAKIRKALSDYCDNTILWIEGKRDRGYRLAWQGKDTDRDQYISTKKHGEIVLDKLQDHVLPVTESDPFGGTRSIPESLHLRIGELMVSPAIAKGVQRVLTADNYPMVMTLSSVSVINPIWLLISKEERMRLANAYSPFGPMPPRIMHLDIFLFKANDALGRPCLLHYFSGKPVTGWQAFMLPFRRRQPGESNTIRQEQNSIDIASFLGMSAKDVSVESLGEQFVVSVKPDPGYSELVVYIFEFCRVSMKTAPSWLLEMDPEMELRNSVRKFSWIHPEEMDSQKRTMLVDGDVFRGVHEFFGTTLPNVSTGISMVLRDSNE